MTRKQREKKVLNIIKKAKDLGLDLDKITEGKEYHTLAHSTKTVENLEKRFKRQKERPKILEEVKTIDFRLNQKRKNLEEKERIKKLRDIKRNLITDESKAELIWNHNTSDANNKLLKEKTGYALEDFFNRYFKQIRHEHEFQKTLDRIKKRFGVRLDLAYSYMEYLGKLAFKYEIPRELMKSDIPQEFTKMLRERLESFENIIGKEFDL